MSGLIYLASPYSHPDAEVREERFRAACRAASVLMSRGHAVVSPIAHSHAVCVHSAGGLDALDAALWQRQDAPLLAAASEVWVLLLPGWTQSAGVQHEVKEAARTGKTVRAVDANTLETQLIPALQMSWMEDAADCETPVTAEPSAALGEFPGLPPLDRATVNLGRQAGHLLERAGRVESAYEAALLVQREQPAGVDLVGLMLARRIAALAEGVR